MVRSLYIHAYDLLLARPWRVLLVAAIAAAGSVTLASRIALDMSFRPLFGQDEGSLRATRRFEERFGQRSGAYIGAIVSVPEWTPDVLERIGAVTVDVERLDHVTEVVSLARAATAAWDSAGPHGSLVLPSALTAPGAPAQSSDISRALADPRIRRTVVSESGDETVILARLDLPLEDLRGRAAVIERFKASVTSRFGGTPAPLWIGISVVEEAYTRLVLDGLLRSVAITCLTLVAVLWWAFRRVGAVAVITAGVSLATPFTLALMTLRDRPLTIVSSMVPTMILIIGVADAIHMFECYAAHRRAGLEKGRAVRSMFGDMALPCLLTALTTIAGFVSLEAARLTAIRDFGVNAACGVFAVFIANQTLIPALLQIVPDRFLLAQSDHPSWIGAWRRSAAIVSTRWPGRVVLVSAVLIAAAALGIPNLRVDQRFNEDVAADHPIRVAQSTFEREFTGLLGPDVSIARVDGAHVLHAPDRERLERLVTSVRDLSGVIRVESVLDHLPADLSDSAAVGGALALRSDSLLGPRVRDVIDADATHAALAVYVADVGSRQAVDLVDEIEERAARYLGSAYSVEVVGQWWLAQLGLEGILRDMLASFATSFATVLPLIAFALRSGRLFSVAVLPNVLPMLFALGFMAWTGISIRIGTAMVLAIALSIAVDDTVHLLVRLKEAQERFTDAAEVVRDAFEHAGDAVVLTTVVLVAGFLGMRANHLLAIQDMGTVAAATLFVALLADLYLLPASYVLAARVRPAVVPRGQLRGPTPAATSNDG